MVDLTFSKTRAMSVIHTSDTRPLEFLTCWACRNIHHLALERKMRTTASPHHMIASMIPQWRPSPQIVFNGTLDGLWRWAHYLSLITFCCSLSSILPSLEWTSQDTSRLEHPLSFNMLRVSHKSWSPALFPIAYDSKALLGNYFGSKIVVSSSWQCSSMMEA